jgi:hypothetical protein
MTRASGDWFRSSRVALKPDEIPSFKFAPTRQMSGAAEAYEFITSLVSVADPTTANPEPLRSSAVAISSQFIAQDSATKTEIMLSPSLILEIISKPCVNLSRDLLGKGLRTGINGLVVTHILKKTENIEAQVFNVIQNVRLFCTELRKVFI